MKTFAGIACVFVLGSLKQAVRNLVVRNAERKHMETQMAQRKAARQAAQDVVNGL